MNDILHYIRCDPVTSTCLNKDEEKKIWVFHALLSPLCPTKINRVNFVMT